LTHFAIIFVSLFNRTILNILIFVHPRPVTGKVVFPGWDGKFLISRMEEGNQ